MRAALLDCVRGGVELVVAGVVVTTSTSCQPSNTPRFLICAELRAVTSRYQTSRSSGVRMVTTCGEPVATPPSSSTLSTTLTGVSSAHSTSSARRAATIASSNPAPASACARRSWARATNPVDTFAPSSASIIRAVASTGTLPCEDGKIAAALRFGPYTTATACPHGGTAVFTAPQQEQRRRPST